MFKSATYFAMFEELLESIKEKRVIQRDWTNVNIVKWHSLSHNSEIHTNEEKSRYGRAYVTELASQYREAEFLLWLQLKGSGAHVEIGFSTDVSESCIWITPFIKAPGDMTDLRFVSRT
jgi:hypothetical protein